MKKIITYIILSIIVPMSCTAQDYYSYEGSLKKRFPLLPFPEEFIAQQHTNDVDIYNYTIGKKISSSKLKIHVAYSTDKTATNDIDIQIKYRKNTIGELEASYSKEIPHIRIQYLAVHPQFRSQKIGGQLIAILTICCKEIFPCKQLCLTLNSSTNHNPEDNAAPITEGDDQRRRAFYLNQGFEVVEWARNPLPGFKMRKFIESSHEDSIPKN